RAVLTDFGRAAFNPSTVIRFVHTILGGWITGSLVAAGIAAWHLVKGRAREKAGLLLKASLAVFVAAAILQLGSGHVHSVQVTRTQPEKMAAFEALWKTQTGAPFTIFGLPDEKAEKTRLAVRVPGLLSFLVGFDTGTRVQGLNEFPKDARPPVLLPFAGYHIMILLGLVFILTAVLGAVLAARKRLAEARGYLKLLFFSVPLPYLANEFGWISAEVGRQPWAVYRVLRTSEAASPAVPAGNILFSLIMFTLIYALIAAAGISIILRLVRRGLDEPAAEKEGQSPPGGTVPSKGGI
ncbi:MAG: cytochrome ubiquinol oxidase subunit I, partial [Acidobacteriota bacterium]